MNLQPKTDIFLSQCHAKGLSDHTIRAYHQDLKALEQWCVGQDLDLDHLFTKVTLTLWIRDMRDKGYAATTIKRRIMCCKIFCKWLEEENYLTDNPFHRWPATIQLPKKLPRNLSHNEVSCLLKPPAPHLQIQLNDCTLQLALELLFATGIRVSELCSIQLNDLDMSAYTIHIKGKGNRERKVFLVDKMVQRLIKSYLNRRNKHHPTTQTLLINNRAKAATPDFIRKALHQKTEALNLPRKITPHMFRHTTATQLLENGVDIRFVQKLLGHASISTTEIYTHVSDTKLHDALKAANPRGKV